MVHRYIVEVPGGFLLLSDEESAMYYDAYLQINISEELAAVFDNLQTSYDGMQAILEDRWREMEKMLEEDEIDALNYDITEYAVRMPEAVVQSQFDEIVSNLAETPEEEPLDTDDVGE